MSASPSFALTSAHLDDGTPVSTVNARDLHAFLEVSKKFADWIKVQIDRALLIEGRDFLPQNLLPQKGEQDFANQHGGQNRVDYYLTTEAAKHVAMMSGTAKGVAVREFFLECERRARLAADPTKITRLDLAKMIVEAETEIAALQHQVVEAAPKVAALERISAASHGATCISTAAKALGIKPKALFGWLRENVWIFRRAGSATWCGYQHRIEAGLLEHKVTTVERPDGSEKAVHQVQVTPKGLARIAVSFAQQSAA